jgi:hypothetical protein
MTRQSGRRVTKMTEDNIKVTGFYNVHDGLKGRDGGPYLDHVERQAAEVNRAKAEGREPADLNGVLPATAGTRLVVAAQLVDNSYLSNPSMGGKPSFGSLIDDESLDRGKPYGELSDVSFAGPVSVVSVDLTPADVLPVDDEPVVDDNAGSDHVL